ncbi:MAG: ARPP-1 family domain-containing protein [Candidatus Thorarchaeota archaeon]
MTITNATNQVRSLAEEILHGTSFSLERPVAHHGLSLVPIVPVGESGRNETYLNAAEAFEQSVLSITEAGDAVNTILARNTGKEPVLIEESEVLVAPNSQDRIVVASVLLQPGEEKRIPVKCVHAPHALNRGSGFHTMGVGSLELKRKMRRMKYQSIMTDVEHYVPETAVDQTEVWSEVERYSQTLGLDDPTKYTDALARVQEKASEVAREIRESLPKETCGVIVVDSNGEVVALEMYRKSHAFWKRSGFLESFAVEHYDVKKTPVEGETAWSSALQMLLKLKDIDEENVAAKEDSDNAVIGLENVKGEALLGNDLKSVLYCTLVK